MAKAKSKSVSSSKSKPHHEKNAKAVISVMVLLIGFAVFMLFRTYQENVLASTSSQMFMFLVFACFALLIGLLFLINRPQK
jgi:nitrate reductase gamma subunit